MNALEILDCGVILTLFSCRVGRENRRFFIDGAVYVMNDEQRYGGPGFLNFLIENHDFERILYFIVGKCVVGIRDGMKDIV